MKLSILATFLMMVLIGGELVQASTLCHLSHLPAAETSDKLNQLARQHQSSDEILEYLSKLDHQDQVYSLTLLSDATPEQLQKFFERLNQNFRQYGESLSIKAQLLEVFHWPKYLEKNMTAMERATQNFGPNPVVLPAPQSLKGLTEQEMKFYRAYKHIEEHLSSAEVVQDMLELQDELFIRLRTKHPNFSKLDSNVQASLEGAELKLIWEEYEAVAGIDQVIKLERKMYQPEDWMAMLREGKPFSDTIQSGATHGSLTHRLQYHLVLRNMRKQPEAYYSLSVKELYSKLGDYEFRNKVMPYLPDYGPRYIWDYLFDSMARKNFTSPEFLRTRMEYHPAMHSWN